MGFSLDVEEPKKEEVIAVLEPEQETKTALALQAEKNVEEILAVDLGSLTSKRSITDMIDSFGKETVERSKSKNQLLKTRLDELSKNGGESSVVVTSLTELNEKMKDLDPGLFDFTRKGLLGKLSSPIRQYFAKYEKADAVINQIMSNLSEGRRTLQNDNTTLECEQQSLRNMTITLSKQCELAMAMDTALEKAIEKARVDGVDEEKIKFMEEEVLFPLRQKLMDIQQLQAVNQQGYFAMEVVRKNNKELIRAVDRADAVTISALRTAVMVAQALANQRLVLNCVTQLNETTNNIIAATSTMLKEQGTEIQRQAMDTAISVETLKEAFANTFEAMDAIASYKQEALPRMKKIMLEFKDMADEGERRISRIEGGYEA